MQSRHYKLAIATLAIPGFILGTIPGLRVASAPLFRTSFRLLDRYIDALTREFLAMDPILAMARLNEAQEEGNLVHDPRAYLALALAASANDEAIFDDMSRDIRKSFYDDRGLFSSDAGQRSFDEDVAFVQSRLQELAQPRVRRRPGR